MSRRLNRREFVQCVGAGAAAAAARASAESRPNIIYILGDDFGYGEAACYGQKKIRTPAIDRLAAEGIRFTHHYSGSPVCAPSRCSLLTGLHSGHAYIRDNDEMNARGDVWKDLGLEGQRPLQPGTVTSATVLKRAGYTTAMIGKWGLGGPGSTGEPNRVGFDYFYGYLCQRLAHNYYPPHLWRNREKVPLDNPLIPAHQRLPENADPNDPKSYAAYSGRQYAPDLLAEDALSFIRANRNRPFFLNLTLTNPHVALQVPEDSLAEYLGAFPETPYTGKNGYLPHRTPRAAYAAMITRLDSYIGRVLALLNELKLEDRTVVIFASDNGPTFPTGGADTVFFESAGGLRGMKRDVYEGGLRVPLIARWPGRIQAGAVSDVPCAFWDMLPTFAELGGARTPGGLDGVSLVPLLTGRRGAAPDRPYLYWEFSGHQAVQLVGQGAGPRWKGVRLQNAPATELYDLAVDPAERNDVAAAHRDVVGKVEEIFRTGRTESELFPLKR